MTICYCHSQSNYHQKYYARKLRPAHLRGKPVIRYVTHWVIDGYSDEPPEWYDPRELPTVDEIQHIANRALDAGLAANIQNAGNIVYGTAEACAQYLKTIVTTPVDPKDRTGRRIQWEVVKAIMSRLRILDSEAPVVKAGQINMPCLIIDMRGSVVLNAARALPAPAAQTIDVTPKEPQA